MYVKLAGLAGVRLAGGTIRPSSKPGRGPGVTGPTRSIHLRSRASLERKETNMAASTTTAPAPVGADDRSSTDGEIRPFQVEIPAEALEDLRRRVAATRWP